MNSDRESDVLSKRLRWNCRRGMRELDFLLTRFLNECYPQLDSDGQAGFAALLECQDPDILDWLMQRRDDYPSECTQVVRLLITSN